MKPHLRLLLALLPATALTGCLDVVYPYKDCPYLDIEADSIRLRLLS